MLNEGLDKMRGLSGNLGDKDSTKWLKRDSLTLTLSCYSRSKRCWLLQKHAVVQRRISLRPAFLSRVSVKKFALFLGYA